MSGTLLRGKYQLQERLGQGGMAVVYAGQHVGTDRAVAIKRLLPERIRDPKLVARFELEARAAGRIRSRHVLGILDIDRDEEGVPFLVMERLFGESLSSKLKREGRLPVEEALGIMRQILLGLVEAHGAGVIHRDLKPANIFLEQALDGSILVKIVDFGISKVRGASMGEELTEEGETLGTMAYMPPEQLGGGKITPATDLWAAGVILFCLLTGEMPFASQETMTLILAILKDPTPRFVDYGVENATAKVLQPILVRALAKEPSERHWGADEMLRALDDASRQLGFIIHTEPSSPALVAQSGRSSERGRSHRRWVVGAFAVGLLLGWFPLGNTLLSQKDASIYIETTPVDAILKIDKQPTLDRVRIPIVPGTARVAEVSADGYLSSTLVLPEHGAQTFIVLAHDKGFPMPPSSVHPVAGLASVSTTTAIIPRVPTLPKSPPSVSLVTSPKSYPPALSAAPRPPAAPPPSPAEIHPSSVPTASPPTLLTSPD